MLLSPQPRNFSRSPMLWIAGYFSVGIALGRTAGSEVWIPLTAGLLIVVILFRRMLLILPLLFIPLGVACYQIEALNIAPDRLKRLYSERLIQSGEPIEIEGVLVRSPEPAYGGYFFRLRAEKLTYKRSLRTASGDVRLFAPFTNEETGEEYRRHELNYGSRIRVALRLEREERFLNPGVASRIEVLDQQGIDAVGTIKSPLLIEKLGEEPVFVPIAFAYELRTRLIESFRRTFSEATAGVMIASLLGDKHFLDRQTAETFREGGTFHVLVISGLHITFIGGLIVWFVSFFTKRSVYQFLIATAFLWAYTFAVGAEVPVVRASVMFSILLFARLIDRESSLLNALGTCTIILLVWRPSDLFTASFQLTFVSVAAIVGCAFPIVEKLRSIGTWTPTVDTPLPPTAPRFVRRFCEMLYWNEAAWRIENARQLWSANLFKTPYLKIIGASNARLLAAYTFEGLLVSTIVQIWMLPFLVVYFHRVSPVSVLLNLWVGLFIAIESFAAVGAILLGTVSSFLAAPLIALTELANAAMTSVPAWLSGVAVASFRVPVYTGPYSSIYWLYAASIAIAGFVIYRWDPFDYRRGHRPVTELAVSASVIFLAFVIVVHPFSEPTPDGKLRADFLDVDQGDSALITLPSGETMLVDGGGTLDFRDDEVSGFEPDLPRIGEAVVSEFLWEKGYSQIDYLVVTHADADHMQGLFDVARNFEIGEVFVSAAAKYDPQYSEFLDLLVSRNIRVGWIARGDDFNVGGTRLEVLNPDAEHSGRSNNDASVVLRISFGSRAILLTGDIERGAEENITAKLQADVVKVPHHGSRTSSTKSFVEKVDPECAVIPVGRRSRFGHPHTEVVERWMESGAQVITTGEKGTVTVKTDGSDLLLRTIIP